MLPVPIPIPCNIAPSTLKFGLVFLGVQESWEISYMVHVGYLLRAPYVADKKMQVNFYPDGNGTKAICMQIERSTTCHESWLIVQGSTSTHL